MPEPPAWRFQNITKPLFDFESKHFLLKGRVLTAVGDQVIENGFVEIDGQKIKSVGKVEELGSDAIETIETGGTILPGLINSHLHLAWDGIHDLAHQALNDTPEVSAYKCAGNMLINLRAGVTTVRDLGMNKTSYTAKQVVEQGIFPGPRVLICGEAIVQTGGHTYWCCHEASGADEMRRAVREQVRNNADLIKIMACHDLLEFTDAELEAVIDESHRNGLYITAHATFEKAIRRMVDFGIDMIEHGGKMTPETIQLLADKKIPIVTTFSALVQQANPEVARKYRIPEWKILERQKAVANTASFDSLVDAAKAGVTIAFGTDAGSPAVGHEVIVPEMKFMIKLGLVDGNYGAIHSATSVAARINRLGDKVGTLEAGKLADGNPLEDLEYLKNVKRTYRDGRQLV